MGRRVKGTGWLFWPQVWGLDFLVGGKIPARPPPSVRPERSIEVGTAGRMDGFAGGVGLVLARDMIETWDA